jgi:hypothetical protein
MAEIVQSLFGLTPEMYQQQQQDQAGERALRFAQLTPMQQANYSIGRGAYGLAGAIGGALGGTDPELQRRTVSQQILGMIDPNRPETFDQAAQMAKNAGIPQLAFGLLQESDKYKQQAFARAEQTRARLEQERVYRAAELARLEDLKAQKIAEGAYTPEQQPTVMIDDKGQPVTIAAQPAYFYLPRVAPELMRTSAGRKQLEELIRSQKSLKPETVTVKEGDVIFSVPTTPGGAYKQILAGGDKPTPFTGEMANASNLLFQTTNPTKIFKDFGQAGIDQVAAKARELAAANRPVTNINMPNESERKSGVLAQRLNFSVGQINKAVSIDPTAAMPNTGAEIARFLTRNDILPQRLTPVQRQIVESAQLDILDAALTLGTGAAYTREQLDGYRKSYFPQIGDKPENVVAKRERLQNILVAAEIASGRQKIQTPIPSPGVTLNTVITAPPSK